MIKRERGITLVSLIITIILMLIISSTVISMSFDRFEINNVKKMQNDIEQLNDMVSIYYLKYGDLPVIRRNSGPLSINASSFTFLKSEEIADEYYIIDLTVMEGISLNYGEDGFKFIDEADLSREIWDVYIINSRTHTIYYVKGVELKGQTYHYINDTVVILSDNIPPSKPTINIISGEKDKNEVYITEVGIEIIPGKDGESGASLTTVWYELDDGTTIELPDILGENSKTYTIPEGFVINGECTIYARTWDKKGNNSESSETIKINVDKQPPEKPEIEIISGVKVTRK